MEDSRAHSFCAARRDAEDGVAVGGAAGADHAGSRLVSELGTTPARYVESIRFDIAKSLLDQG